MELRALARYSPSKLELASKLSRPLSVVLVTKDLGSPGSHGPRCRTSDALSIAQVRLLSLSGVPARSVQLPTTTTTTTAGGDRSRALPNDVWAIARAMASVASHCRLASAAAELGNTGRGELRRLRKSSRGHATSRGACDLTSPRGACDRSRSASHGLATCRLIDARDEVRAVARDVMGTVVEMKAPLMSAGLDSIATTEFVSTLAA